MSIFVAGTDTAVGKTVVSSWLCLHTQAHYFKPVQAGTEGKTDRETVQKLSGTLCYPEVYLLKAPLSPHMAAEREGQRIELSRISLPAAARLIVEGAGGLLSPLNDRAYGIDLIRYFNLGTLLVTSARLGAINQTLLSIEALRNRDMAILGVVLVGEDSVDNAAAIERYGCVEVVAILPYCHPLNKQALQSIPLTDKIAAIAVQ